MFDFFKGKKKPVPEPESRDATPAEQQQMELLCRTYAQIMLPQIRRLEFEPGKVPPVGLPSSHHSRGYIYGICYMLMGLQSVVETQRVLDILMSWAFDETYGLMIGHPLAMQTLDGVLTDNEWVLEGMARARLDFMGLVEKRPDFTPMGFWWFASGAAYEASS